MLGIETLAEGVEQPLTADAIVELIDARALPSSS
jgi:hypothetical protein